MISFFSRRKYLVDYLEGFIDIHNHILPGIDDGSKTTENSIEIIQGFKELGVVDFIATPHIMHNYYENTPKIIENSLKTLQDELLKNEMPSINIKAAAEHMIDSNFEVILESNNVMPLTKEHLLIEMSYLQPPINFDKAIVAISQQRLFPVLAHPERYNFLHPRAYKYKEFKNQGILFQLNMLSLGGHYGKEITKIAIKLLEQGMIDFIGSDVHNITHLNAIKNTTLSKKMVHLVQPVIEKTIEAFRTR